MAVDDVVDQEISFEALKASSNCVIESPSVFSMSAPFLSDYMWHVKVPGTRAGGRATPGTVMQSIGTIHALGYMGMAHGISRMSTCNEFQLDAYGRTNYCPRGLSYTCDLGQISCFVPQLY